jgi:antitoxin HicB
MTMQFDCPARLTEDEAGFWLVTFPDFPEAATDARTREDALRESVDCLEEAVAGRLKRGDDVPAPSPCRPGETLVTLPALHAMKAALYQSLRGARLSQSGFAARLGKDEKEVRRLLDPDHASRTPAMEDALRRMGKRVRVVVEDAFQDRK